MSDAVHNRPLRGKWQFSLKGLLAIATIVALACVPGAYFGPTGLVVSLVVCTVVATGIILVRSVRFGTEIVAVLVALGFVAILMLPSMSVSRTSSWRNQSINNMRQLMIAMHCYERDHGTLPPAYVADASGKPLHSWRVLLLPYLEERKRFNAYRWDEPWNGPNNSQLADCPEVFQSSGDPALRNGSPLTSYVIVGGPGTAFPGDQSTKLQDIAQADGTTNTILIVEVANSGIHWMEPRDLNVQQMAPTINAKNGQGISSAYSPGAIVAFADGHTMFLPETVPAGDIKAMVTIDGGEIVDTNDY